MNSSANFLIKKKKIQPTFVLLLVSLNKRSNVLFDDFNHSFVKEKNKKEVKN